MRCLLGTKKTRKIEELTGRKVKCASVRGGEKHFWAIVNFEGEEYDWSIGHPQPHVNYKTGEIHYPEVRIRSKKQIEEGLASIMPIKEQDKLYSDAWDEAIKHRGT